MASGITPSGSEMVSTAVFRIVVSSDSLKKATVTSHGKKRLMVAVGRPPKEAITLSERSLYAKH